VVVWGLCARSALFCCHELGEGGRFGRDYPRLAARRASALWVGLRAPGGGRRVWPGPEPHWRWPSRHACDLTPPPPPHLWATPVIVVGGSAYLRQVNPFCLALIHYLPSQF
jgi:hypothetical protein